MWLGDVTILLQVWRILYARFIACGLYCVLLCNFWQTNVLKQDICCFQSHSMKQRRIILLALRGCSCEVVSRLLFFGYSFHQVGFSPLLLWNRSIGQRDGLLQVHHQDGLTVTCWNCSPMCPRKVWPALCTLSVLSNHYTCSALVPSYWQQRNRR